MQGFGPGDDGSNPSGSILRWQIRSVWFIVHPSGGHP